MKNDCIFCKIAAGEIPSEKIFENEEFFAFLDLHPHSKGHTLVVPKAHADDFLHMPSGADARLFDAVSKTAKILKETYSATGFNITTNIGKSAGQIVFHAHIHIIPRY